MLFTPEVWTPNPVMSPDILATELKIENIPKPFVPSNMATNFVFTSPKMMFVI